MKTIQVLDHGYVLLVETFGSDQAIVEAARMSTGKGFLGWGEPGGPAGDEKLLRYLHENKHATPFEFGGMVIEVQAPIFVFREWHRHRTQSYNEASARYAPLPELDYVPTLDRVLMGGGHLTKQAAAAGGSGVLTEDAAKTWLGALERHYKATEELYQYGLSIGIPKELARAPMAVGRYSKMRAFGVLRNWLGFLTLRMAPAAQWEIRQYANAVGELIAEAFPRTWELFAERKATSG